MNFYSKLLKAILGIIDKEPGEIDQPINRKPIPRDNENDNDKLPDSYKKFMGDYQYHFLGGAVVLIFGVYIYLYWDSISGLFKRDRGDDSPSTEGVPSIVSRDPSSGQLPEHYPEGYLRHFSKK